MSHPLYSQRKFRLGGRTMSSVGQSSPIQQIAEVHTFYGRKAKAQIGNGPIRSMEIAAFWRATVGIRRRMRKTGSQYLGRG